LLLGEGRGEWEREGGSMNGWMEERERERVRGKNS
jgi:hypothetical protein